jgi:hypothetical protein
MAALYEDYRSAAYTAERDFYEPGYATGAAKDFDCRHPYIAAIEAWLAPNLPDPPLVLDWGGGSGINTPFLGKGKVHIHDISGVTVVKGAQRISKKNHSQYSYDLVCSQLVLEHVASPLKMLREIVPAMSQKTLLYLEVPYEEIMRKNPKSNNLAQLKHFWHEHINFYTEIGLHRLCGQLGLQILDVHYQLFDNGVRKGEVIGVLARLEQVSN